MKINFKVSVKNFDGELMTDAKGEPIYLHKQFADKLAKLSQLEGFESSLDLWQLALKINAGETVDLKTDQQESVKKFIEETDFIIYAKAALLEAMNKPESKSNGKEKKQNEIPVRTV